MPKLQNLIAIAFVAVLASASLAQNAAGPGPTPQSSVATVPRLVNFSGTAFAAHGHPASSAGVTFAIYREATGGAPLWIETQTVSVDSAGHFTALLGATKPAGLPLDLFTSGEARWLGVRVDNNEEQQRILLLSVPYALKAADAETVGGLPPSAFVLAAPVNTLAAGASPSATTEPAVLPPAAVTGTGTASYVPLWTGASTVGNSVLFQTGTGSTARIGVNTTTPGVTLDVKGSATIRGTLALPAPAVATAAAGKSSQPLNFTASAFNSSTAAAVSQTFRWQSEPAANDTAAPSATLNLLFAQGTATAAETGLKIAHSGQITFAAGQTFPGTGKGTVTSVGLTAPSSDFTVSGSPVTGAGTLNLNWAVAPTSAATNNAIVKRDAGGSFSAVSVTASSVEVGTVYADNSAFDSGNGAVMAHNGFAGGYAIEGNVGIGVGVFGDTEGTESFSAGVYGYVDQATGNAIGVKGYTGSQSGTGVYGSQYYASNTGTGHNYSAGVWGDSETGVGVMGTSDNSNAFVGSNNSPTGYTTAYLQNASTNPNAYVLYAEGPNFGGSCSIDVKGDLSCSGSTSAAVSLDGGKRKVGMSAIQSPRNWFEDAGSGQLRNGTAVVALDPDFAQVVNTQMEYQVFLTPYGDCKGLYVTNRTANSFEVHELGGGVASVGFGYRLMALRKNYENVRFADHTSDPTPFLAPVNKGAAAGAQKTLSAPRLHARGVAAAK